MPIRSYEIRVCTSCGLRYPLVERHPFGTRCPVCMGDTRVVLERHLDNESQVGDQRKDETGKKLAVLLDNIRSAWNVGSILRSADGFGFTHAYLCGITPAADHEAVTKTSLGAENSVPWTYHRDAVSSARGLKVEGWRLYALEEDERAVDLNDARSMASADQRMVLMVGNEVTGVDPELLDLSDQIFYIPMRGEKRSLNVTTAFGVAAFALRSQKVKQ